MTKATLDADTLLRLVRKLGHDIRAPLGALISTSDMLAEGVYEPLNPKQAKANERIQRNSRRVLAVLDDFITFAKADAGHIEPVLRNFDPRQTLIECCDQVRAMADSKGLALELTIEQVIPNHLIGDQVLVGRALMALLWNAVAFTQVGEIHVYSDWTDDDHWLIRVQDSGPGITPELVPQIFEPFWRGEDRPQLPTAGAGLGLPLAKSLARLMDGELILERSDASGSSFCLLLPMLAEPEPEAPFILVQDNQVVEAFTSPPHG